MHEVNNVGGLTIDGDLFQVLINDEQQYSLWPASKGTPAGWSSVGFVEAKAACLAYVDEHWIDMRPLTLQASMAKPDQ